MLDKYSNLLRPCTKIEKSFMEELQEQLSVLDSLYEIGISTMPKTQQGQKAGDTHIDLDDSKEMSL